MMLKTSDTHSAKIFDEYHELDHQVRRIEEGVKTTSDEYIEGPKKERLLLKDRLFEMIKHQLYIHQAGAYTYERF